MQPAQGGLAAGGLGPQQGLVTEGRQARRAPFPQGRSREGRIALAPQGLEQGVIGMVSLKHHPPRALRPPGATSHLDNELGHALGGAEIGAIEAVIGIQDTDQGYTGKVVALGQHLGADQQRVLPGAGRC